jgi:hypothetical protein
MTIAGLPSLFDRSPGAPIDAGRLSAELRDFRWGDAATIVTATSVTGNGATTTVDTFVNEFWTSRQRAAHSLHEISYRACFKPQLPRFFIERLTQPGDVVYDPFMGRGTTVLEAALMGRIPVGCDVNPLSAALVTPRLRPATLPGITSALSGIDLDGGGDGPTDLLTFYHPDTLREICALRQALLSKAGAGELSIDDAWVRMVALNRLTGHSRGFFSVYTLPPNQAASVTAQRRINLRRNQEPPRRDVVDLIRRKSRSLLSDCDGGTRATLESIAPSARLIVGSADSTPAIADNSIDLVVTSPPFLDVVNYAGDNWLRCWFCGIDPGSVSISVLRRLEDWEAFITRVFQELRRVLRPGGYVAFEVGEVRGGTVRLEESVIACAAASGLTPVLVLVNAQEFTKTANCWGVSNNTKGTNSNRIVLLRK